MPPPGLVPNMMPPWRPFMPDFPHPDPDQRIFGAYVLAEAVPPDAALQLTRAGVVELDAEVEAVRRPVERTTRGASTARRRVDGLVVFDTAQALRRFDSKHNLAPPVTPPPSGWSYTSHAIGRTDEGGLRGELASLDSHHPSTLGHRLLAREIAAALGEEMVPREVAVTDADDEMLTDPPQAGPPLLHFLHMVRTGAGPEEARAAMADMSLEPVRLSLEIAPMR